MKKILILFLLSFPIIIFTIVTFTSSVISYYVPLAVESIEIIKGEDISDNSIDNTHELSFQILPKNARNMSFEIRDEDDRLLVDYNEGDVIRYYNNEENIVLISSQDIFLKDGLVTLSVKTNNIGFTKLSIITKDGNHRVFSDIMVLDNNLDPGEIQGVVLDYNKTNEHFKFGNKNNIEVGFTYFPKSAINVSDQVLAEEINERLKNNALKLEFNLLRGKIVEDIKVVANGRAKIVIAPNSNTYEGIMSLEIETTRTSKFNFKIQNGYNISNESELFTYKDLGTNLFVLNHIELNNMITFNNGTNLYGNNFQINHSKLKEYQEKDQNGQSLHVGKKAITMRGNNSGLYDIHIVGALDENNKPYENIVNVQMDSTNASDLEMNVKNVIIENGRYNLSVRGKISSLKDPATTFNISNVKLVGAYLASFEIDNHSYELTESKATIVNLSKMEISYTAIGILLQNNRNNNPASELNLIEKDNTQAIKSTSWRNLDDASGALSTDNFGYILQELKSELYKDVYYKDGKDYYVNPVIMLRGGARNRSVVNFDKDYSIDKLIRKERKPKGLLEVGIVGGTHPFVLYLLDPSEYRKE